MSQFIDWLFTISTTCFARLNADAISEYPIALYMAFGFCLGGGLLLVGFSFSLVPLLFKLVSRLLVGGVR